MNTQQLVSYIKRGAPDWSRVDILEFIETIQTVILGTRIESLRIHDVVEGGDPVFLTEDGVLQYILDSTEPMYTSDDPLVTIEPFGHDVQFFEATYTNDTNIPNDLRFTTKKASPGSPGTITFNKNPGSVNIRVQCYRKPAPLDVETANMEIPVEYAIPHVYTGVRGLIEMAEHGSSNAYVEFMNVYLPEARAGMNAEGHNVVVFSKGTAY